MWHSLHVYYEEPDALLSGCVEPLVGSLRRRQALDRFFFLRYWEKGFHLRLRFALSGRADIAATQTEISTCLRAFLATHPCERRQEQELYWAMGAARIGNDARTRERVTLAPNNSVTEEPYVPELDKYGGSRGVEIAEAVFDRSAACVLQLLPVVRGQQSRRLGLGLAMMLEGLRAFGVAHQRLPAFLQRYYQVWRGYLSQVAGGSELELPLAGTAADAARARVRWLSQGPHADTQPFRTWTAALRSAAEQLTRDADRVLPHVVVPGNGNTRETKHEFLVAQFLHVNNNRLGLSPVDECQLAWLAHSALESAA